MRLKSLSTGLLILLSGASIAATPAPDGGWYPVFFQNYDQSQVNSIVNTVKSEKARRVVVLYDTNKVLANKIIAGIQSQVNFAVESNNDVPKDSTTTKYNHDQVVVTVFLKI